MKEQDWKTELNTVVTRYHLTACWAAVALNPIWTVSDYFICPSHWKIFLVIRILVSACTFSVILLRKKLKLSGVFIALVPFVGIAFQNAYMYSVMDVEAVQNHTFAYIALFIGAGMFLVWKPIYSILVIIATLILNVILFSYLSPISADEILKNGGLLTLTVSIFTILLAHTRYLSVKREIVSRLSLKESNLKIREQKNIIEKNAVELQEINTKLSRFAYVISHDLKAPLRGIKNLASWIEEDNKNSFSAETKEYLSLMGNQTESMDKLINGILNYSRAGNGKLEKEEIDLNELLNELAGLYIVRGDIKIDVAIRLPVIYYNRATMTQVYQNLLSNAIKHNDKEVKEIKIFCVESEQYFEFVISDNGPGIAVEHHERIFELFQTLSEKMENTGIGLPVVKKLVEDAGGRIWIESYKGQGTSFRFTLPKSLFNNIPEHDSAADKNLISISTNRK